MTARVLVAGIGNIFFGDDGFGVEVARRLAHVALPEAVRVADYGISGMHLAYDLLEGFDTVIMADALSRGDDPGTVFVLDVRRDQIDPTVTRLDAHGIQPAAVLSLLTTLGGAPECVRVVGCEPASTQEGIGLSEVVSAAVDTAVRVVAELVEEGCEGAVMFGRTRMARGR